MYTPRRDISPDELKRFDLVEIPSELAGLTSGILADLSDQLRCTGFNPLPGLSQTLRQLYVRSEKPVLIEGFADGINPRLRISKGAKISGKEITLFHLRGGHISYWDVAISVEDVVSAMRQIDTRMTEKDLIDRQGRRKPSALLQNDFRPPVYWVDEVFGCKPLAVVPVLLETPDELLSKFDRPEDLAIVGEYEIMPVICLRSSKEDIENRLQALMAVIRELGITDDNVLAMSPEEILRIHEQRSKGEKRGDINPPKPPTVN